MRHEHDGKVYEEVPDKDDSCGDSKCCFYKNCEFDQPEFARGCSSRRVFFKLVEEKPTKKRDTNGRFVSRKQQAEAPKAEPKPETTAAVSDGSTASYYELPEEATELQHLISHRAMNAQIGEIFRACYRYGLVEHSPRKRDIKKIIYYATAELARLENLESTK